MSFDPSAIKAELLRLSDPAERAAIIKTLSDLDAAARDVASKLPSLDAAHVFALLFDPAVRAEFTAFLADFRAAVAGLTPVAPAPAPTPAPPS